MGDKAPHLKIMIPPAQEAHGFVPYYINNKSYKYWPECGRFSVFVFLGKCDVLVISPFSHLLPLKSEKWLSKWQNFKNLR